MRNSTSAMLMMQTIITLMDKQNATMDGNSFPTTYHGKFFKYN